MEKSEPANPPSDDADDEFMDLTPRLAIHFDQVELSNAFALEQSSGGEHEPFISRDPREECKIPERKSVPGRVYVPPSVVPEFESQPARACEVTPVKQRLSPSAGPTPPSDHVQTTPEDAGKNRNIVAPSPKKHYCKICHKTYKKRNNLVSHMRKHVTNFLFRFFSRGRDK